MTRQNELQQKIQYWKEKLSALTDPITLDNFKRVLKSWNAKEHPNGTPKSIKEIDEDEQLLYESTTAAELFDLAKDWDDLRALMSLFIQGYLPNCPTQIRPLDPESESNINNYLKMIELGAIFVNSQQGVCNEKLRQRPNITFFTNNDDLDADELYRSLNTHDDILVSMTKSGTTVVDNYDKLHNWKKLPIQFTTYVKGSHRLPEMEVHSIKEPDDFAYYTADGYKPFVALSAEKKGEDKEWEVNTMIWWKSELKAWTNDVRLLGDLKIPVSRFQLVGTKFCEKTLLSTLISELSKLTDINATQNNQRNVNSKYDLSASSLLVSRQSDNQSNSNQGHVIVTPYNQSNHLFYSNRKLVRGRAKSASKRRNKRTKRTLSASRRRNRRSWSSRRRKKRAVSASKRRNRRSGSFQRRKKRTAAPSTNKSSSRRRRSRR